MFLKNLLSILMRIMTKILFLILMHTSFIIADLHSNNVYIIACNLVNITTNKYSTCIILLFPCKELQTIKQIIYIIRFECKSAMIKEVCIRMRKKIWKFGFYFCSFIHTESVWFQLNTAYSNIGFENYISWNRFSLIPFCKRRNKWAISGTD